MNEENPQKMVEKRTWNIIILKNRRTLSFCGNFPNFLVFFLEEYFSLNIVRLYKKIHPWSTQKKFSIVSVEQSRIQSLVMKKYIIMKTWVTTNKSEINWKNPPHTKKSLSKKIIIQKLYLFSLIFLLARNTKNQQKNWISAWNNELNNWKSTRKKFFNLCMIFWIGNSNFPKNHYFLWWIEDFA